MAPNIGAIILVILSSWTHILPSSKATTSSDSIHNKVNVIFSSSRCCRTENIDTKSHKHCKCVSIPGRGDNVEQNDTFFQVEIDKLLESIVLRALIYKRYRKYDAIASSKYKHRFLDKYNNIINLSTWSNSTNNTLQVPLNSLKRNSTLNLIFQRLSYQLQSKPRKRNTPSSELSIRPNKNTFPLNKFHFIRNLFTKTPQAKWLARKRNWNRSYSKNVFVFGRDDRTQITSSLLRKFPYSNIVRLSTGCTGTLVTPSHVLTAAHCVHNGREFLYKLEMMKVEVPDPIGVRDYYIEKISIPDRWLNPRSRNYQQASFDYAVVRLSYGVHGRYQFLPLSIPTESTLRHNLQFLGFTNYGFGLWRSVCPARTTKPFMDGNLILARCDSAIGNSGASVFTTDFRSEKRIVGVLSSTVSTGDNRYSVITALTETKLLDICTEIGPVGVFYGVCPSAEAILLRAQGFQRKIKTIPFFG